MKKHLLTAVATLCFATTTAFAQENVRKLVCTYTLGEILDEGASKNKVSKKTVNYYDYNNMMVYTCEYGAGAGNSNTFTLNKYTKYDYATDENGDNIQTVSLFQWGLYDFGDYGFKASKPSVNSRKYDKKWNLLQEVTSTYTYDYEYSEDGLLQKMTKSNSYSGAVSEITTYTYENSLPVMELMTDANGAFKQKTINEYEDGNKVDATIYKRKDKADELTEYVYMEEQWTYTDGVLTEYVKKTGGSTTAEPYPTIRKTYEVYNGNSNMTLVTTYSNNNKTETSWKKGGLPVVEEYADFIDDAETVQDMFGTLLDVKRIDGTYNVSVSFPVPNIALIYKAKFDLYRDGHYMKTVSLTSENFNNETGIFTIVDDDARAGEHEYFVQTMLGRGDELATEDELIWQGTNISPVAKVDLDFNLLPVTNLTLAKATKEDYLQEGVAYTERMATIGYENPVRDDEAGFVKNELYFRTTVQGADYFVYKDETSDANVAEMRVTFDPTRDVMDFVVITHYKYGNVKSEILTVTKEDFEKMATSIASLTAGNDEIKVAIEGNEVRINGTADITIYTADGRVAAKAANVSSMPLNDVKGTFIVCVAKDGKVVKAVKGVSVN